MFGEIVNTLGTTTYVHCSTRLTILQPHRKVDDNKRYFFYHQADRASAFVFNPPLHYVSGEVVYALHGDAADSSWLEADPNQPIAEDMSVQTGQLARARIRIGPNA